jgi:hypothetical protein
MVLIQTEYEIANKISPKISEKLSKDFGSKPNIKILVKKADPRRPSRKKVR